MTIFFGSPCHIKIEHNILTANCLTFKLCSWSFRSSSYLNKFDYLIHLNACMVLHKHIYMCGIRRVKLLDPLPHFSGPTFFNIKFLCSFACTYIYSSNQEKYRKLTMFKNFFFFRFCFIFAFPILILNSEKDMLTQLNGIELSKSCNLRGLFMITKRNNEENISVKGPGVTIRSIVF